MTAATLSNNLPALATPFDNGLVNSVIPSPAQLSSGFVPNVDKINAEQQNWLHNAGTTAIFLGQQLGLALPFNPVAGASIVATPAGGVVSVKNNSTGATEFYIAKNNRAIGYTDPSLDPTNWVFFNITALAQFAGFFAAAGGTSDAITASYTVPYPVLVDGFPFTVKIGTPNATTTPTFAPTINGSVQTARTIVKFVNNAAVALAVGDLTGDAQLRYDLAGTRYILENPKLVEHASLADLATTATNQSGGTVAATTGLFSGLLSVDGGQIKFPAAQSASADPNTLDDYEEGTFTGTYTPTTGSIATINSCTYVKIGKVVTVNLQLSANTVSSPSGALTITGLPFAPQWNSAVCLTSHTSWGANIVAITGQIFNGQTQITPYYHTGGNRTQFVGTDAIAFGSYLTASASFITV